jgi:BASS family bile acid:Na+ symporter
MDLEQFVPVIVMFALVAIGLELRPSDFSHVRRRAGLLVAGLALPVMLLPLVAIALVLLFDPPRTIAAGVFLVAACPIGGISNTYSYLASASVALSVTLTTLSSLLAVVTVPLIDRLLSVATGEALGIDAPMGLLAGQLLVMLALPVAVGMLLRHRWPEAAARWHGPLRRAVFVAIGALLMLVIERDAAEFLANLRTAVPMAVAFVVIAFGLGWMTGVLVGGSRADCFTLGSEFSTRNVAVATAIAMNFIGRPEYAIFATAYFMTEVPMLIAAAAVFRGRALRRQR